MEKGNANSVLRSLPVRLRATIDELGLSRERLPRWLDAASIRTAWVNDCFIAVFEDGSAEDIIMPRGLVHADTVALLDIDDFVPRGSIFDWPHKERAGGLTLLHGELGEEGGATLALTPTRTALFNTGYMGYFSQMAILNMFISVKAPVGSHDLAIRFVPFALFLHQDDLSNEQAVWERCRGNLVGAIQRIHDSATGDYYLSRNRRFEHYGVDHTKGVIVLGKYPQGGRQELRQVRDELMRQRYDAHLIEDLPETPLMAPAHKVRQWTGASRFSVMVDRDPSGHLTEFQILKEQETILALLRPRGHGSTWMIGAEPLVDYNFIRVFEFDESPLEVLDEASTWANEFADRRSAAYTQTFPWKKRS